MNTQFLSTRIRLIGAFLLSLLLLTVINTSTLLAQRDDPENIPQPESVTIAGTMQTQLGCAGNWNTGCTETMLTYDPEDDLWTATFALTAGSYEYKAALNETWDDNYGRNAEYYGPNIPLEVTEDGPIMFWYDHKTRWVSDSVNSLIANVSGDFQDEIGCPGDWQPDCLRSLLADADGDGRYTFITAAIPAGSYEAKVAYNQSWDENYGADGAPDGPNISFTVGENEAAIFLYDPVDNLLIIRVGDVSLAPTTANADAGMPAPAVAQPDLVVIPGTLQSVLGCSGDWQPDCENTALIFDEEDQLWQNTFTIPAGEYEYKVALNGSWDVNFGLDAQPGGPNIPLALAEETEVTFYFSTQTGWVTDSINDTVSNVPGDYQDEIGCPGDWQPDCLRSWLQDPDGDGTFVFQTDVIPAGTYEAKVAVGQSWSENYGDAGAHDGPNIPFTVPTDGELVTFAWDSGSKIMSIRVGAGGGPTGNIKEAKAHWVTADTIAWDIDVNPDNTYRFYYSPTGGALSLSFDGIAGGTELTLTPDPSGLSPEIQAKFPHLADYAAFKISEDDLSKVRIALKGQVAVSASDDTGTLIDATSLQIPGVLDDLYVYDGPLGVTYEDNGAGDTVPVLRVWAPTAQSVRLMLFADSNPNTRAAAVTMRIDPKTGVWSVVGEPDWDRQFYLYEVRVFAPSAGSVVENLVTDPYSFSLSLNSTRSQIVNLEDTTLQPDGWSALTKPPLAAPEDITIYELHIRDFSIYDQSVPEAYRGTYMAFTADSDGMRHLAGLAAAGISHLHLLPSFDIATINEDAAARVEPDPTELAKYAPDSEEQQTLISSVRDQDGFNWGYDPFHYTVPEGSYSTDPDGVTRVIEYRRMVQALNDTGLRVVMDVVYNHTNASGQNEHSVLDKIVPGYYHRLTKTGRNETSTCCQNTATEHAMMRKLMVDSVVTWAKEYKIDAFRFDLMGHHMLADMLAVRAALDELTIETDGVDGRSIYLYGEGWDFGEVAGNARGINATQANVAGTGIGTFNDRLRDAVRGGTPFDGQQDQGFITGLYYDPNDTDQGTDEEQKVQALHFADLTRVGLTGNLAAYEFIDASGNTVTGADIDYNGNPAGYTADPQENIVYISKHDNETLFDAIQYKAPLSADMDARVRMQNLGNSIVLLSQGVPFFQAGDDMLRSKSLDRNSYNSGDWFNAIDWTYETNNWGKGLPSSGDNQAMWPVMAELLGNPDLMPTHDYILKAVTYFREFLQIRYSSPLFRLHTAAEVQNRLRFYNTGPEQTPGVIVMSLSDMEGENLDPTYALLVVLFNANDETLQFSTPSMTGLPLDLHPVLVNSPDKVKESYFDPETATFTVPGRTTAVFVLTDAAAAALTPAQVETVTATPPAAAPTATPMPESAVAETTPEPAHSTEAAHETEATGNMGTAFAIWGAALGIGALIAIIAALLTQRQKPTEHH